MKRLLFLISLGVAGALLLRAFVTEGIYLASNSMYPILPEGTHVFVNKAALLFREPERGEIVMFKLPQEGDKGLVKRVVAVEGDVVAIREKQVFLNGDAIREPYKVHLRGDERLSGDNMEPILIPDGSVFVLGDNRDYSKDSRDWIAPNGKWAPYVPVSLIKGVINP